VVVAGGAAPVDAGEAFAFRIGAELPEILADAALAPSMPAGDHRIGDTAGLHHAIGHEAGALAGAGQRVPGGGLLDDLADGCHVSAILPGF
jgi:hypothetical protein